MILVVKNPPANAGDAEDVVRSMGGKDVQEEGMATHSSILVWRIPRRRQTEKTETEKSLASYRP